MSSPQRRHQAKVRMDGLIVEYAPAVPQIRDRYWRLISAVRSSSTLLVPWNGRGRMPPLDAIQVVQACARVAFHHDVWRREPETWASPDGGPFAQLRSLVQHLFDQYPTPRFMAQVWWNSQDSSLEIPLYLHLAAGRSIRAFELPVPIRWTRLWAALFMQAPDDLTPREAIRWAHVRSLKGDNRLARLLIARTCLAIPTEHEEFWESVIRFLVKHAAISADEIVAIVEFIDGQRFQPAVDVWGPGAGQLPLQPQFSVEGRSLMSLRRHIANWRFEFQGQYPPYVPKERCWEKANIKPFHHVEGSLCWSIDELLTAQELRVEGGIMQHCVASYIPRCSRRQTSIWSLKIHQDGRRKRLVTIEVLPDSKTIWQAKGPRNAPPSEFERTILQQWADREGLQFR